MRRVYFIFAAVFLSCPPTTAPNLPPTDVFYFPTGLHHVRPPGSTEGVLYVVSSNFDKRYDFGLLTAVNLDNVGMPRFGGELDGGTPTIVDLKVDPDAGTTVFLSSFGSNIAAWPKPDGGERLFIVARSENRYLMAVDTNAADPTKITCISALLFDGGLNPDAPTDPRDCSTAGASLTYNELSNPLGVPRAPSPLMTAVSPAGVVWVTSGDIVDSPRGSGMNLEAFVVRTAADLNGHFLVNDDNFINVGAVPTDGVAIGQRWAYVSGRYSPTGYSASFAYAGYTPPTTGSTTQTYTSTGYPTTGFTSITATTVLLRLIDETNLLNPGLELQVQIPDARGLTLSSDESRLYILGRLTPYVIGSDQLIVASIGDPTGAVTGTTAVNAIRSVPLCDEPQELQAIPRPGHSDLVIITCSGGAVAGQGGATAAGVLALYDDDVGDLVGQVPNIGLQPDSLAIDVRPGSPTGVRVFVSNFTDGRVAIIDVPDVNRPQDARLVGYLGAAQTCVTRNFSDTSCDGGVLLPDGGSL